MGTRIITLATNVATEVNMVCKGIKLELSLLRTTVDNMNNLKANLSHVTKTLLPDAKTATNTCIATLASAYEARLTALELRYNTAPVDVPTDDTPAHGVITGNTALVTDTLNNMDGPPPHTGWSPSGIALATDDGSVLDLGHTGLPVAEDTTYTLPTGHVGSRFGGPTPPFHSKRCHRVRGTNDSISNS